MGELEITLRTAAIAKQMEYAAWFADERLQRVELRDGKLVLTHSGGADADSALRVKLDRLAERFAQMDEFEQREMFRTPGATNIQEPYPELVAKGWVVELGRGQVTLRGLAYELLEFLDASFVRHIGGPASARREYYPSVMTTENARRTNHFSSFPEHIHFVTHLREDLDVLDHFARELREAGGWNPELLAKLERPMASPAVVLNPSVCYNCYASLANSVVDDGVVVTARSRCHRYESGNHKTLSRLMDFSMREIIYIGHPDFVKRERQRSIDLLKELLVRWGLASWLETANDPFFTNDFEVKAKFQRQNDMKFELRMPLVHGSLAAASSNFHAITFGKAFDITHKKRPACTGCIGFGLERWIYAIFSQAGLDPAGWPPALRSEFAAWQASHA